MAHYVRNENASVAWLLSSTTPQPHRLYDTRHLTASCRQGDWGWPLSSSAISSSKAVGVLLRASAEMGGETGSGRRHDTRVLHCLLSTPHLYTSSAASGKQESLCQRLSASPRLPGTADACSVQAIYIASHLTRLDVHTRPKYLSVWWACVPAPPL